MALTKPIPSARMRKAFRDGLAEMIRLGRAPKGLPRENYPQQIYSLGLEDIVKGIGVRAAKPVVWEFLVGDSSGPAIAVYVGQPPRGTPPKMTSVTRGPMTGEALKATHAVEALPQLRVRNYELRRLRISGLSIGAFWLKSEDGGGDLAVPYHAVVDKLVRMRAYPMEEFLSIVRPLAAKRLKFDDSPRT